eukprot:jgi/Chlat1/6721/Chrsp50S06430
MGYGCLTEQFYSEEADSPFIAQFALAGVLCASYVLQQHFSQKIGIDMGIAGALLTAGYFSYRMVFKSKQSTMGGPVVMLSVLVALSLAQCLPYASQTTAAPFI